jgi:hypothetical protein
MATTDGDIMNTLVRMVVPMRREFGYKLDVAMFTSDSNYAEQTLQLARSSQDPRLQDYAKFIDKRQGGASAGASSSHSASQPKPKSARENHNRTAEGKPASNPKAESATSPEEQAMRAKMMKKYTSGLR